MKKSQKLRAEKRSQDFQEIAYYPLMVSLFALKTVLTGIALQREAQELWKVLISILILPSNIVLYKITFYIKWPKIALSFHLLISLTSSFFLDTEILCRTDCTFIQQLEYWILFQVYQIWIMKLRFPLSHSLCFMLITNCFLVLRKLIFLPERQDFAFTVLILVSNFLNFGAHFFCDYRFESKYNDEQAKAELNNTHLLKLITKTRKRSFLVFDKKDILFKKQGNISLSFENLRQPQEIAQYLSSYSIIKNNKNAKENETLKTEKDFLIFEMDEVTTHDKYETIIKGFLDGKQSNEPHEFIGFRKSLTPKSDPDILEITIGNFDWKGKKAIYLSIDENHDEPKERPNQDNNKVIDLASILGHTIKNPVNGLLGLIQNMPGLESDSNLAINQICLLSYSVDHFLDYFGIVDGNIKLNFHKLMLNKLTKEMEMISNIFSAAENLEISIDEMIGDSNKYIYTDINKLKQIIISLVNVSLKLTQREGSIQLEISKIKRGTNEYVQFKLIQKGLDYTEDQVGNISRLNLFNKEENEDFNILFLKFPLWITFRLLQYLNNNESDLEIKYIENGLMSIEFSMFLRTNISSDFSFGSEKISECLSALNIPARSFTATTGTTMRLSIFSKRKQEEKPMILIVDDDEINIMIETNYVKSFGKYDYIVARNGLEAVELVANYNQKGKKIDIILMDCNMPVKDGLQASFEINCLHNERKLIKRPEIIAVTANTTKYDQELCKKAGMDHFLSKPLKIGDLEKMLNTICKKL